MTSNDKTMLDRSLRLLAYFADGCHCQSVWDSTCFQCQARSLLTEAGWIRDNTNGNFHPPKPT